MKTQSPTPKVNNKLKVDVAFDPTQKDPAKAWTFTPDSLPVGKNTTADIKFHQKPNDPRWDFVTATVKNGGGQFTVKGNGNNLTIHDENLAPGTFQYSVTVQLTDPSGKQITSPDPQIVNSGPELGPG